MNFPTYFDFQVNFYEYLEVVYEALGRNGPDCNNAITAAIEELEKMMAENNFEGLEGKAEKILKRQTGFDPITCTFSENSNHEQ